MNEKWLTYPGRSREPNFYFRARRRLEQGQVPESLRLHISAESHYRLWLNGRELGMGPARGTRSVNFYDIYELKDLLSTGTNILLVLVQCMNKPNFNSFPCCAGLYVHLGDIEDDLTCWEVAAGDEWRQDVELFSFQTGFSEYRDLSRSPDADSASPISWVTPEILCGMGEKKLLPRPIPFLRHDVYGVADIAHTAYVEPLRQEVAAAEAVTRQNHYHVDGELMAKCLPLLGGGEHSVEILCPEDGADVSIVFDFGREIIGFFELQLSTGKGVVIDLAYDEELVDGRIDACRSNYHTADRYLTRAGRQTVGNTIHERGFRMVEMVIRNLRQPIVLHVVEAIDRRYPWPQSGSFNCSDMRLNRIWEVCVETLSCCTTDIFNDCPWRERAFWVNDLIVENITSLQVFGDYRFNAHALRLALSNRRPDGLVPGVCPDDDNPRHVLVPTNLFIPLILRDYYLYSGDRGLVDELLPAIVDILRIFASWQDTDALLSPPAEYWNFFDWSYELNGIRYDGIKTSLLDWLHVGALNAVADLLEDAGCRDEAASYRLRVMPIVAGLEKHFRLPEGIYADTILEDGSWSERNSQLNQALALLSGGCPALDKGGLALVLDDPALLQPELYLHYFVLNALRDNGRYTAALARIRKYWGSMMDSGTPTLWEAAVHQFGKSAFANAGSLCHGFSASPVNYFQTVILGVIPLEPGFFRFKVEPIPYDLEFAAGRIPTPAGAIRINWHKSGAGIRVALTVPFGLTAVTASGELKHGRHEFEL